MTGKPVSGDKGIRTLDPLLARQVLSQLSYTPMGTSMQQQTISLYAFYLLLLCISSTLFALRMGLSGLEPPTSRLSGVRSNQLSYKPIIRQPPILPGRLQPSTVGRLSLNHRVRDVNGCSPQAHRHRKYEVIFEPQGLKKQCAQTLACLITQQ